ncbi:MAG: hypothetical protein KC503_24235 [Myxococcales bacterium]|nr:hypothetical protein [Myxococcales bacterium]
MKRHLTILGILCLVAASSSRADAANNDGKSRRRIVIKRGRLRLMPLSGHLGLKKVMVHLDPLTFGGSSSTCTVKPGEGVTKNKPLEYPATHVGGLVSSGGDYRTLHVLQLGFGEHVKPVFPTQYAPTPIGAIPDKHVRHYVKMMVLAVAGDTHEKKTARDFFAQPENKLYPAESQALIAAAAANVPLNKKSVMSLGVSESTWSRFEATMLAR